MNEKASTISQRLLKIRESTGLSQAKFAASMKLPQSTYSKYERGASISDDFLAELALKGIDINWLLTGQSSNNTSLTRQDNKSKTDITIPIISSRVSAGPGEEWKDEDFLEGEMLPLSKDIIRGHDINRLFAARVKGDSMIGAMIYDGDFVFAERGEISGDGIYIFSVDNEVLIKRLEYDVFNHKVNVISENPAYPARTVDEDRIVILGKVIGWLHRHPL